MSEVINHGKGFWREIVCQTCSCRFRFRIGEVEVEEQNIYNVPEEVRDYMGGRYSPIKILHAEYVTCPDCKSNVYLEGNETLKIWSMPTE